jgi:hypothetical protein
MRSEEDWRYRGRRIMKRSGFYVGTLSLEKPWYNRSTEHGSFPQKGAGEYWFDYKGFYFVGHNTNPGLVIPSGSIIKVEVGFWHGMTLSWTKILKIVWRNGSEKVSSGFLVSHAEQARQALTTSGWA